MICRQCNDGPSAPRLREGENSGRVDAVAPASSFGRRDTKRDSGVGSRSSRGLVTNEGLTDFSDRQNGTRLERGTCMATMLCGFCEAKYPLRESLSIGEVDFTWQSMSVCPSGYAHSC